MDRPGYIASRIRGRLLVSCLLCLAAWSGPHPAQAMDWEKVVMPGELAKAHAKAESDCSNCHRLFDDQSENEACQACHEAVAADVAAQEGLHGRRFASAQPECRSCHSDHRGRDADLLGLEESTFDHGATDFALEGAHARLECSGCHESGVLHREAPSRCLACHEKDDAHDGGFGKDCADCHGSLSWRDANFDHSKTDFALEERHVETACGSCHPNNDYKNAPTDCVSCHRLDDVHAERLGSRCGECHSPARWDAVKFDHNTRTDFVLRGPHDKAACEACHVGDKTEKLSKDCGSCHRLDDAHRGRNGNKCERCHSDLSWKDASFDHAREVDFPLRGAHERLECESCHKGGVAAGDLDRRCLGCHAADALHRGKQGKDCERCHNEKGWRERVFFDHELTRFPLLGLHAAVSCEECHSSPAFADAEERCVDCHRSDDIHTGRLGPQCGLCHNPNGWPLWRFDHDLQTPFALLGEHAGRACKSCHRSGSATAPGLSPRCDACHSRDDVHRGSFGRDCSICHEPEAWKKIRFGR